MKIIIFCLPGLGDTIMFTPCLRLLREKFPKAEIVGLTMFSASYEVLKDNPYLDDVTLWEFLTRPKLQSFKFLFHLRKQKFDLSIMPFPAYRRTYNIVSLLVGAKERIAHKFSQGYFRQFTFLNTETVSVDENLHNVENNLNLLKSLDVKIDNEKIDLDVRISENDEAFADSFLEKKGLIRKNLIVGIHPGTIHYRRAYLRRWPKEKFVQLANLLKEKYGAEVLVFEGSSEVRLGEEITRLIKYKTTVVSGLTIKRVAAIVKKCNLFVSNDSGLMHVAAAMKVPTVVILGPTNPKWIYPWGAKYRIVRQNIPCSPCYTYALPYLNCWERSFACIQNISANKVFEKVEELIKEMS